MTKTYLQIVQQIEALRQEAESLRKAEVAGVVAKIREAMQVYGLSVADLGLTAGRKTRVARTKAPLSFPGSGQAVARKASKALKSANSKRGIKYRNDSGGTWGGIGKRPQWLRDALAAGKRLEDFAVK